MSEEMEVSKYHGAMMDLVWGEHGHCRNQMVRNYWLWLDNIKGLGASRAWCEELVQQGVQEDRHAHIIAAVVAERLGR